MSLSIIACDTTFIESEINLAISEAVAEFEQWVRSEIDRLIDELIPQEVQDFIKAANQFINDLPQITEKLFMELDALIDSLTKFKLPEVDLPDENPEPESEQPSEDTRFDPSRVYYITTDGARARTCPSTDCDIAATFDRLQSVEVVAVAFGQSVSGSVEWYEVKNNSSTIFVHSSLTSLERPSDPPENPVIPISSKLKLPWLCCDSIAISRGYPEGHSGIDFNFPNETGNYVTAARAGEIVLIVTNWDSTDTPEGYDSSIPSTCKTTWCYGNFVKIRHDDQTTTLYAHLLTNSSCRRSIETPDECITLEDGTIVTLVVGDQVSQGEIIGEASNSGNVSPLPNADNPYSGTHLHFEQRSSSGSQLPTNFADCSREDEESDLICIPPE